jgi:hypothetical protein
MSKKSSRLGKNLINSAKNWGHKSKKCVKILKIGEQSTNNRDILDNKSNKISLDRNKTLLSNKDSSFNKSNNWR